MNTLDKILDNGIIAISRGFYEEKLMKAVSRLIKGGIKAFEVTFEQGGDDLRTAEAITMLKSAFGNECAIGAGTVLTKSQLELAHSAGAEYIISPNTDMGIIRGTKELGLVSIPGAMTPTEIVTAVGAGADAVKLFPAGSLGIDYFKAVRAPLPGIKLFAVAGVNLSNIADFKRAGACGFGISSSLFNRKLIDEGKFDDLEYIARAFLEQIGF